MPHACDSPPPWAGARGRAGGGLAVTPSCPVSNRLTTVFPEVTDAKVCITRILILLSLGWDTYPEEEEDAGRGRERSDLREVRSGSVEVGLPWPS